MNSGGLKIGCLFVGLPVLITGCFPKNQSEPISLNSIAPTAKINQTVKLVMMGTDIPAKVVQTVNGGEMVILVKAHDEILEQEIYRFDSKEFRLTEAGGETYSPPIPLLKEPIRLGDKWHWSGTMALPKVPGGQAKPSDADLIISSEKLNVVGGPFDSYKVSVALNINDGSPLPSKRELRFWFVPGKGLVKREFDYSSLREPDSDGRL